MADKDCRKIHKNKKKKKRFLMGFENSWLIHDKSLPVYSHIVNGYSKQLLENPFQIKVKQEPQEHGLLESLPLVDQQEKNQVIILMRVEEGDKENLH